jgi:hypothetical protein
VFLKPHNLVSAWEQLKVSDVEVDLSRLYYFADGEVKNLGLEATRISLKTGDKPSSMVFNSELSVIAYTLGQVVYLGAQNDMTEFEFPESRTVEVLNFSKDGNELFVFSREDENKLYKIYKGKVEEIYSGFNYERSLAEVYATAIDGDIILPDCKQVCEFVVVTRDGKEEKRLRSRVHGNPDTVLEKVDLKFIDYENGLIGYDNLNEEEHRFYVINFGEELLQNILLSLIDLPIDYVGYVPESAWMVFSGIKNSTGKGQVYAYSANSPKLKILRRIVSGDELLVWGAGVYTVNDTAYAVMSESFEYKLQSGMQVVASY